MEAAVRHLRDGVLKGGTACPLVLLCDSLETVGALDVLKQLCDSTLSAVKAKRAQASRSTLVLSESRALEPLLDEYDSVLLDCHSDPCGWHLEPSGATQSYATDNKIALLTDKGLEELYCKLAEQPNSCLTINTDSTDATSGANKCVIIDSLSTMLLHHPPQQVMAFIDKLRMCGKISCIITSLNEDLHDPNTLLGIEHLASCVVRLKALSDLHKEIAVKQVGRRPHGSIEFRYRRRLGRVLAEVYLYTLAYSTGPQFYAAPPEMFATAMTPDRLVALGLISKQQQADSELRKNAAASAAEAAKEGVSSAVAAADAAASSAPAPATAPVPATALALAAPMMAGGMRLELSEAEKLARERVVLPYEHSGHGKTYQTGDFRDYLPPAAGGYGAGGAASGGAPVAGTLAPTRRHSTAHPAGLATAPQPLGHILYVRDSDGSHDSDEDPDDDLDF
eukprot:gene14767-20817_t